MVYAPVHMVLIVPMFLRITVTQNSEWINISHQDLVIHDLCPFSPSWYDAGSREIPSLWPNIPGQHLTLFI